MGIGEEVKDCLFPFFCADCGEEGEWWCKPCRKSSFNILTKRAESGLDSVTALFCYGEKTTVGKLIHDFKYNFVLDLVKLWKEVIADCSVVLEGVLVPVPLFKRRERERGYNQSAVIAGLLSEQYDLSLEVSMLRRVRYTEQQAKLAFEERKHNVKNAFVWNGGDNIPKKVILVDDVYTTGATMGECARVLRESGVASVEGFVLARG